MSVETEVAALTSAVNDLTTSVVDASSALTVGVLSNNVWKRITGLPRLLLNGTGTISISSRNRAGTITTNVFDLTTSSAVNAVHYPFFGQDAIEIRATFTGTTTGEII